ncbi:MAG TPA: selenocysteine-specific translation elongation factor [Streptosporangiaceae bacterium]|nr:selenocysteine-specific translation elongation factor [Streptosporangiaceae bacterium]
MQVIATAGHVDHGKSTLVRALTGMEPDRWAEERRRGLTIDLGFCWLTLPSGERLAFVDVPGHERFVPNMLAGVGPVPAVLFTVAADEGWMPQSEEHLAAVHALGIRHGLLAVTRADLADPADAMRQARERIAATSLGQVEAVPVSAVSGAGLPELTAALDRLVSRLPGPAAGAPVRLWVDRAFSIRGAGQVVTGTLAAGTIRERQELQLTPALTAVRVRGIETLKQRAQAVTGVARVAVNLRADGRVVPARGMALVEPGRWALATVADVRLAVAGEQPPRQFTVHIGAARTVARVRPLGGRFARLTLRDALPLHVGDRLLVRDPGAASGTGMAGATVLDLAPPGLSRRGAAAAAAAELAGWPPVPGAAELIRRHRLVRAATLRAMGVTSLPAPVSGDWLADPGYWAELRGRLAGLVSAHLAAVPLSAGLPVEAARAQLGLPTRQLAEALAGPALVLRGGSLRPAGRPETPLPEPVRTAVATLRADLARQPFAAPEAGRLRELGLDSRAVAAAARAGLLLRITEQIVLTPGADQDAVRLLAQLPQPFTAAQARQVLGTTRRVAIPLLEYLDRRGRTRRLPDGRRLLNQVSLG